MEINKSSYLHDSKLLIKTYSSFLFNFNMITVNKTNIEYNLISLFLNSIMEFNMFIIRKTTFPFFISVCTIFGVS